MTVTNSLNLIFISSSSRYSSQKYAPSSVIQIQKPGDKWTDSGSSEIEYFFKPFDTNKQVYMHSNIKGILDTDI